MAIGMPTLLQASMLSRLMNVRNAEILLASRHIATGYRVATARDDPFGMARIQGFESQIRGLNQAVRNAQQGISLLQTADGGAEQIRSTITELQALVTAAGDATLTSSDLNSIQTQVNALLDSIDSTANGTTFNGLDLLTGTSSPGSGTLQVTFTDTRIDGASATSVTAGDYDMTVSTLPKRRTVIGADINSNGNVPAGSITVNGTTVSWSQSGTPAEVIAQISSALSALGVTATVIQYGTPYYDDTGATNYQPANGGKVRIALQNDSYGTGALTVTGGAGLTNLGLNSQTTVAGSDIAGSFSGPQALTATGSGLVLTGTNGGSTLAVTVKGAAHGSPLGYSAGAVLGPLTVGSASAGGISTFELQTGASAGQTTTITTYNLTTTYLGLSSIDVTTSSGRTAAATDLAAAASLVDNARASMGGTEAALQSLVTDMQNAVTNMTAAQSNIRDVDAAAEMTRLATLQILQNASAALLSQTGSSAQQVFQVLFSGGITR